MITINDSLQSESPKSLDNKYLKFGQFPYVSVADVNATIVSAYRSPGLTVLIGTVEYWYFNGVLDTSLIPKGSGTVPWGSITGTLANQIDLQNALNQREPAIIAGTVLQYWRGDKTWQTLTSDVVTEGSTNLYFTQSRARQSLSAGSGITYNNSSGVISLTSGAGQLQSDWNESDNTQVDYIKNKPTIPAAQVNSDWNASSGLANILNKPTIPAQFNPIAGTNVTLSGSYPNITINSTGGGSGSGSGVKFMWIVGGASNFAGISGSPTPPTAGATTLVNSLLAGSDVRVAYNGFWLIGVDPGDGSARYTKTSNASNTVTFSSPIVNGDQIIVETLASTGGGGGGGVSSVSLSMPAGFTVSGSPVTTSGNIAVTTALNGPLRGNGSGIVVGPTSLSSEVTGNLPTSNLNSGTNASGATYWRGDGTWVTPPVSSPGGSNGMVQFNSLGAFGGNANLFWDNSSFRLGVGTSSPFTVLHAASTSTGTTATISNSLASNGAQLQFINNGSLSGYIVVKGTTNSAGAGAPSDMLIYAPTGQSLVLGIAGGSSAALTVASTGALKASNLAGTGTRMVVADSSGNISTQTIGSGGTVTSVAVTVPSAFSVSGSPITSTGTIAITAVGSSSQYIRGDGTLATLPAGTGTVTSVGLSTTGTALTVTGSPVISAGTLALTWAGTSSEYVSGNGTLVSFPSIPAQVNLVAGTNISITGTYPNLTVASSGVTAVGLTMPGAFSVTNSPVTSSGTIAVTATGTISQYIRGDGSLATFPSTGTGTVTSVNVSGGSTNYTFTGGPVVGSGTMTMTGPFVNAGAYTPIFTNFTNVSSAGAGSGIYQIVGNVVYVTVTGQVTLISANTSTQFTISKPVTSSSATGAGIGVWQANGNGLVAAVSGMIFGHSTTDVLWQFYCNTTFTQLEDFVVTFSYTL